MNGTRLVVQTLFVIIWLQTNPGGKSFDVQTGDRQVITVHMERPLDEPVSGLLEIHGTVQGRGQIFCNNYIPFPPEMSENFGKYIWSAILIMYQVKVSFYTV